MRLDYSADAIGDERVFCRRRQSHHVAIRSLLWKSGTVSHCWEGRPVRVAARLLIVVFVGVAAVWLWGVLFPSPDRVIRKRLAEIAAAASFAHGQSYLSRLAGA